MPTRSKWRNRWKHRRRRESPELHWGKNYSRGHIPHVPESGSGESLFGRSLQLPKRSVGDLVKVGVAIAAGVVLNFIVLNALSWWDLRDALTNLSRFFVVFLLLIPVGFVLALAYHLVRGRKRPTEELPVFLIGFALVVGGSVIYGIAWFLFEVFRQSHGE